MNQTASALHDELAHNDIAGLHQTLNSVSRNDLEIVEADYKAIGGKSLIDSVDKDPSVSPAAKDVVHQKLAKLTGPVPPEERADFTSSLFDTIKKQGVLNWLSTSEMDLGYTGLLAQNQRYQSDLDQQLKSIPSFYKQFLPAGAENDPFASSNGAKSADEAIRNKLGQYSLVEVKALEDYSRDFKRGSSGILEFLSRDEIASPETKKFIADLQSKI
jgi:hypothetical protein